MPNLDDKDENWSSFTLVFCELTLEKAEK
jgi:hypothetical protein